MQGTQEDDNKRGPPSQAGRRRVLIGSLAGLLAGLSGTVRSAGPQTRAPMPIRFAPERNYGPFVFEADDGSVQGLSVDLLEALAPLAGLQLVMQKARPLAEILEAARRGEVDLISSLRPTPERAAFLNFTHPYVSVPAVLVTLPGPVSLRLSDFSQRRVAVGKGYAVEAFGRQQYPEVDRVPTHDDADGLRRLSAAQVAAVVCDVATAHFYAEQLGLPALQIHASIGFEYPLSFAYLKSRPDIGERLEEGLRLLPQARLLAVTERWLEGREQPPEEARTWWLKRVGLGLCALALGGMGLAWWAQKDRDGAD